MLALPGSRCPGLADHPAVGDPGLDRLPGQLEVNVVVERVDVDGLGG
jgi:hypothetical protein